MNITFFNYKKVFQKNIWHLKVKQKKMEFFIYSSKYPIRCRSSHWSLFFATLGKQKVNKRGFNKDL